jgi:formylmethanofuran dehydrogenase subunit D
MLIFKFFKLTLKYNPLNFLMLRSGVIMQQKLQVTLVTGRTIEQGVAKEQGKSSPGYFDACSMVYMDSGDMKKLGLRNGDRVLVTTPQGSVVLKAEKYPRDKIPGLIYIPYGPWANAVCSDVTTSIGTPSFKGTPAEVEAASDRNVLSIEELLRNEFGR